MLEFVALSAINSEYVSSLRVLAYRVPYSDELADLPFEHLEPVDLIFELAGTVGQQC